MYIILILIASWLIINLIIFYVGYISVTNDDDTVHEVSDDYVVFRNLIIRYHDKFDYGPTADQFLVYGWRFEKQSVEVVNQYFNGNLFAYFSLPRRWGGKIIYYNWWTNEIVCGCTRITKKQFQIIYDLIINNIKPTI